MLAARNQLTDPKLTREERERIAGQAAQYSETARSLELQQNLLKEKLEQTKVVSPIDGEVLTWQAQEKLLTRPVEKGQVLLTVADESGDWQIELHMPEDRMGAVGKQLNAIKDQAPPDNQLKASYVLATNPGARHYGHVVSIEPVANVKGDEGNVVLMKIAINKSEHDSEDLRPGAAVTAKIDCGA